MTDNEKSGLGELKGPHVFDAKAAIAGNDYNPIVEKMAKKIADDVEEATKGEMSDNEKSGLREVLSERSETIKKELKDQMVMQRKFIMHTTEWVQ